MAPKPRRRKQKGRKVRINENHAAARLVERTGGAMRFAELKRRVTDGEFEYYVRQSTSRSLCRTPFEDGFIYFVINRQTKSIVTILDEDQLQ